MLRFSSYPRALRQATLRPRILISDNEPQALVPLLTPDAA